MLALPESGLQKSKSKHNVDKSRLCDWIEASAVFHQPATKSDIVDILTEEQIYSDQDFAAELVDQLWQLLRESSAALGRNSLVKVESRRIIATSDWREHAPTAFMLLLSLAPSYEKLRLALSGNYAEQGALFESVSAEAMSARGWSVFPTGWQSGIPNMSFKLIVDSVADFLQEPGSTQGMEPLLTKANDAGLDLVCSWPFLAEARLAMPVLFMQCASGANWTEKLHTPDPALWAKLIPFVVVPTKAMTIPFQLSDTEFKKRAMQLSGVLIDRLRLLHDLAPAAYWASPDTIWATTQWVHFMSGMLEPAG